MGKAQRHLTPEALLASGIGDPRTMQPAAPASVPYGMALPNEAETMAMKTAEQDPDEYIVLRLGLQGMDLQADPVSGNGALLVQALIPRKLLKVQTSTVLVLPDGGGAGHALQDALGPSELRLILRRDYFDAAVATPAPARVRIPIEASVLPHRTDDGELFCSSFTEAEDFPESLTLTFRDAEGISYERTYLQDALEPIPGPVPIEE